MPVRLCAEPVFETEQPLTYSDLSEGTLTMIAIHVSRSLNREPVARNRSLSLREPA
jgi:hypothetical protein